MNSPALPSTSPLQSRRVTMWPRPAVAAARPGVRSEAVGAWRALQAAVAAAPVLLPCQADRPPFFGATLEEVRAAAEACAWCPARVECLAFATANRERHGVWGGREFGRTARQREAAEERRQAQGAHTQHAQPSSSLVSASSLVAHTGATESGIVCEDLRASQVELHAPQAPKWKAASWLACR